MAVAVATSVRLAPITDADVCSVAVFLHAHLNSDISASNWAEAIDVPWEVERPNAGFMLVADDRIVGAQLAFYSERMIDDRVERFCNLGAWCVLPAYRLQGLRLLKAALGQAGYHFTDLSPSGNVVGVNTRLDFQFLDTSTVLVPNLPWPRRGDSVISSEPALIERTLTGPDLQLFRDHAATGAARHLVLIRGEESCYVIFRKDRWKRVRAFATILHVGNPGLYRALAGPLAHHLLVRHGAAATLAEERVIGYRPRLAVPIRSPRRRMFRSENLDPAEVDYLYSELVCVSW